MQTIQFAAEELEVLRDLLAHHLAEIDVEVFRTDTRDFKMKLKHRREILEQLLAKISEAPAGVAR
jgi:hypothetical protein